MEIQYYGANCVRLTAKKASVVIDDNLVQLNLKPVIKPSDIVLFTHSQEGHAQLANPVVIDTPGEYEVSNVSIQGIAARAHMDDEGQTNATIFKIVAEDLRVAAVGHIYPELSDIQLESLGTIDILIVPFGNGGYTLDATGALKIIKKIEPKIIIPTHFADKAIKYPVPQQELSEALKILAMEPKDQTDKLKLKAGEIGDITQLIVLERQSHSA